MNEELQINYAQATDVGRVRDHNEDWVSIEDPTDPTKRTKGRLFIVADGMGGYQAGEVASQLAADTVRREYYADPSDDPAVRLSNAVQIANGEVRRQAQSSTARAGMGTTIVAVALIGRQAYIASVGDSRAYVIHQGAITQITQDHSFVGDQVRAGILTQEQARSHPQRNVITRALGSQPTVQVDTFMGELSDGDVMVLCTDGLTNHVTDENIRDTVLQLPPDQAVRRLIQMANDDGGSDNISVIVLRAQAAAVGKISKPIPAASLRTEATVPAAPALTPPAPPAAPAVKRPVPRPTRKSSGSLMWLIGGAIGGLLFIVVLSAAALIMTGGLPRPRPTATPAEGIATTPAPLMLTVEIMTVTPQPGTPTSTPRPTNTPTSTPTATRLIIYPTVAPTHTPQLTPTIAVCPEGRVWNGTVCACPPDKPLDVAGQCLPKGTDEGGGGEGGGGVEPPK